MTAPCGAKDLWEKTGMISNPVNSLSVVTVSELQAMLKLVQMVCHADQYTKIDREDWSNYCMTAFGWDQDKATFMINKLRKMANRELAA